MQMRRWHHCHLGIWEHHKRKSVCTAGCVWSYKLTTYSTAFTQSRRTSATLNYFHTAAANIIHRSSTRFNSCMATGSSGRKLTFTVSTETQSEVGTRVKVALCSAVHLVCLLSICCMHTVSLLWSGYRWCWLCFMIVTSYMHIGWFACITIMESTLYFWP